MTPRLFVRDDAAADIEATSEWYEERRRGLGGEFTRAARAALAGIARQQATAPRAWRSGASGGGGVRRD